MTSTSEYFYEHPSEPEQNVVQIPKNNVFIPMISDFMKEAIVYDFFQFRFQFFMWYWGVNMLTALIQTIWTHISRKKMRA